MFRSGPRVPELIPELSRGKHRRPRKGACFMELVSYLAGEKWSDHPACTHPLLAALARLVNDHTSDAGRRNLVELAPSVIGLTSSDPRIDVRIALRAAITALPVVSEERQRVLAVAVLAAEQVGCGLDGRPDGDLGEPSRKALEQVPQAARWARSFNHDMRTTAKGFHRHGAPNTVRHAVVGIAHACIPDPDTMLRDLLVGAIEDCAPRTATAEPRHSSLPDPAAPEGPAASTGRLTVS
jgi:hypothetical protein